MRWRGVLSVLVLALVWAALDDITTDNANTFHVEYSILVAFGLWFAGLAAWFVARRRVFLGVASLVAVALAVPAFWDLPHHYAPASPVNDLGLLPLAWFLAISIWLVARRSHVPRAQPAL